MSNRGKISLVEKLQKENEILKTNIEEINNQKMTLRAEYVRLQQDFIAYKTTCEEFISTIKEMLHNKQGEKNAK